MTVSATTCLSMISVPPSESRKREIFQPVVFLAPAITVSVSVSGLVAVVVRSAGWYGYDKIVPSPSSIITALTQRPG